MINIENLNEPKLEKILFKFQNYIKVNLKNEFLFIVNDKTFQIYNFTNITNPILIYAHNIKEFIIDYIVSNNKNVVFIQTRLNIYQFFFNEQF